MSFERTLPVRFADVDYARVVYYPRFFDYAHQVFEDFFAAEVGVPYAHMLQAHKVGFPSVHCEADFKSPLLFGDTVRIILTVQKVSTKSVTCHYRLYRNDDTVACAELGVVTVATDMDSFSARSLPNEVRAAFLRHT